MCDLGHIIQYLHFLKFNFGYLDIINSDTQQLMWKREEIFEMEVKFPSTILCLLDISANDFVFRTCCVSFSNTEPANV